MNVLYEIDESCPAIDIPFPHNCVNVCVSVHVRWLHCVFVCLKVCGPEKKEVVVVGAGFGRVYGGVRLGSG